MPGVCSVEPIEVRVECVLSATYLSVAPDPPGHRQVTGESLAERPGWNQRILLTREHPERLQRDKKWRTFERPREVWEKIPGLRRVQDTFACMGGADPDEPRMLNMLRRCVAGFDQVVCESSPKEGEPDGNATIGRFRLPGGRTIRTC